MFSRPRYAVRFRRKRGHQIDTLNDHHRSPGERRALLLSCAAAIICVLAAIAVPHWSTIHAGAILSGLSVLLYVAPRLEDRELAPQPAYQERPLQKANGSSSDDHRRAA